MSSSTNSNKGESASTYVVHDSKKKAEVLRLTLQNTMITTAMGGVFAEQHNPDTFHDVLDVGCGTGGWILEAAQTYPEMHLVGIDISALMIENASVQAKTQGTENRVEFHVMDALKKLEFPDNSFDFVNLRFGTSYVRTWDWPALLLEMQRVARPGGIIRITECEIGIQSTSQALMNLYEVGMHAFYRAGHLFTEESTGVTKHLAELLTKSWCEEVQTKSYPLIFRAGTTEGQAFKEDIMYAYRGTRLFIQNWIGVPANYDAFYEQSQRDMQHPDFSATWPHLTVWGHKPRKGQH